MHAPSGSPQRMSNVRSTKPSALPRIVSWWMAPARRPGGRGEEREQTAVPEQSLQPAVAAVQPPYVHRHPCRDTRGPSRQGCVSMKSSHLICQASGTSPHRTACSAPCPPGAWAWRPGDPSVAPHARPDSAGSGCPATPDGTRTARRTAPSVTSTSGAGIRKNRVR